MKNQMFNSGDMGVINTKAKSGLPDDIGKVITVKQYVSSPSNYDYYVETEDGEILKVKESELNKLTPDEVYLHLSMKKHKKAIYHPTNEVVKVVGADYIYGQIEIEYLKDGAMQVVGLEHLKPYEESEEETVSKFKVGDKVKVNSKDRWNGSIETIVKIEGDDYWLKINGVALAFYEDELELVEQLEEVEEEEQPEDIHEELLNMFLGHYQNEDNTYTVPKELLLNILKGHFYKEV